MLIQKDVVVITLYQAIRPGQHVNFRENFLMMSFFIDYLSSFVSGAKNGNFSYGYSSYKGKRASMEDFYHTSTREVNGQMVAFFGVFDGTKLNTCCLPLGLRFLNHTGTGTSQAWYG